MINFEWDSDKERRTIEKHGLDLETVSKVFDDPFRIMRYDVEHSGFEDRLQILGRAGDVLLAVYTERGETVRVITARKATPQERRIYYGTDDDGFWFNP